MYPEEQGILAQPKKPGPLTRAANSIAALPPAMQVPSGIAANTATSPNPAPASATIADIQRPAPVEEQPKPAAPDPFAYRGGVPVNSQANQGIAAQPNSAAEVLNHLNLTMAEQGSQGVGKPQVRETVGTHAAADSVENSGIAAAPIGRNDQGVITADSAAAAMGGPMTRSGGIAGSYDGAGINERMAKSLGYAGADDFNKKFAEKYSADAPPPGGWAPGILPDQAEEINRQNVLNKLSPKESAKYDLGRMAHEGTMANQAAQQGITTRGQDLGLQRAQERNGVFSRGQDMRASTAADRIDSNEAIASDRISERAGRGTQTGKLTTPQQRTNAEIEASRKATEGLTPEEIKRKTSSFTATGRENPEYDESISRAVKTANRRMYGEADDWFDNRQQPKQAAGNDGDTMTRFRADQAMQGHKLGKQSEQGVEVLDASGKLIGHYR
jgi:hypothetical protein